MGILNVIGQGNVFKDKHENRYILLGIKILGHNDKKCIPRLKGQLPGRCPCRHFFYRISVASGQACAGRLLIVSVGIHLRTILPKPPHSCLFLVILVLRPGPTMSSRLVPICSE